MKKRIQRDYLNPTIIGLLAFALRLWNSLAQGSDFYANFLSDASTYRVWAAKLAAGGSYGEPVFQMGPLYPYFLALNLKLGISNYAVLFLQAIFGSLVAIMVYFIAKSIFDKRAAFISGLLTAVYAPFIFYDGLLLSESIQIFLLTLSLLLLVLETDRYRLTRLLVAGILLGITALGRATILLFPVALVIFWSVRFFRSKIKNNKELVMRIGLLFAGILIGIMPAAIHNLSYGDSVLISSNTGINFYIGNNSLSNGAYEEPPGLDLATDFTGRQVAEREMGHHLKSSEVSSFWMGKTMSDIKRNPLGFVGGLIRKTWLYLWYFDISQAESIEIQHLFSPIFKLPLAGFGLAMILGWVGLLWAKVDDRRWILILLFLSNFIGTVMFFVIGRFKLIGALPLLVASGAGAMLLYDRIRKRNWKATTTYASAAIIILMLITLPRPLDRREKLASAYDNVGIFYYYRSRPDESIKWYRRAQAILPDYSPSLNNIGTWFYGQGQLDSSEYYFRQSLAVDSLSDKTLLNLGHIASERGNLDTARAYYERAREVAPFGTSAQAALNELDQRTATGTPSFDALFGLAEGYAANGQFEQAEKYYLEALKLNPVDIKALNNLGFAYQAEKKYADAARTFDRILQLWPDNAIVCNNLAGTIYQMGLIDSSITLWEKAVRLDPANPQFRNNLDFAKKKR
jgi:Tfp pilus assembly protein PilF/4-amino-4-deoxy-L-arabinose transferase-like glycosyltransferase